MASESRRTFLQSLKWSVFSVWAATVTGASELIASKVPTVKKRVVKSLSLTGYAFQPATRRKRGQCAADVVVCVEVDVVIKCTTACDGCDRCNTACNTCNACNGCDHGCDPGCNTCNSCNGCNRCDMCDSSCNTCNQCDHGADLCVLHCDSGCDGCHGSDTCTVDINKNGRKDSEDINALQSSIRAMEMTLERKRTALARLRKG